MLEVGRLAASTLERLIDRVVRNTREATGGCVEWTKSTFRSGYGKTTVWQDGHRHTVYAHHLAYLLFVGEIPEGLWVLHACDNPRCIAPTHLWLGTHHDNMADMRHKGRSRKKGADNPQAKLTARKVRSIRKRYRMGKVTLQFLADHYGVSAATISNIVSRKLWPHVEE